MDQSNKWLIENIPFLFTLISAAVTGIYWLSHIVNGNNKSWIEQKEFNKEMKQKNELSLDMSNKNEKELIRLHGLIENNNIVTENIQRRVDETLSVIKDMGKKDEEMRDMLMKVISSIESRDK